MSHLKTIGDKSRYILFDVLSALLVRLQISHGTGVAAVICERLIWVATGIL